MPFNKGLKDVINRLLRTRKTGTGYLAIQSTKPQTLGYSLADSPVGLLAWIYEKLARASDDYPWTEDEGWYHHLLHSSGSLLRVGCSQRDHTRSTRVDLNLLVLPRGPVCLVLHLLRSPGGRAREGLVGHHDLDVRPARRVALCQGAAPCSRIVRLLAVRSYFTVTY